MHIVFVEPEIPPNTGTTARLCAATNTSFHLVGPLGFSLEDRYLKRAGLDYWPHVDVRSYPHWSDFLAHRPPGRLLAFSAKATRSYTQIRYTADDLLIFGSETRGLPDNIRTALADSLYTIPMQGTHVRSLNLATAAAIVLYEALRQLGKA
ncbi:MAG TPA: tRNA (cytidine(34)-2'-O)-methyltransferase [Candidatus Binatia bacterium]|nr:tRNA (cytidine(34)-2'-O)-methyltransferase [Candidatus Binatia bacterium]